MRHDYSNDERIPKYFYHFYDAPFITTVIIHMYIYNDQRLALNKRPLLSLQIENHALWRNICT